MDVNDICPTIDVHILDEIEDETLRAWKKHGEHAMINPALPTTERLAILGEEFGEVCKALTYDSGEGKVELKKELIQLAAMAASWASCLQDELG
jgi:histidyl-tRNA synthetase